ncbi:BTB/POZ and MATH domain-containing protein 4-like isoform X2 [Benincasa hispida]|uniref:BTB/POZ and MATH domain-containing protein 4-like isoform X2 n=1 Tax=Benincasa hispida TaxID=102211 RepID=UPI001901AE39|nr:BTB/POZ and MATH domain-containing protein 4-like isoform X2 [Benincasa hispida]
MADTNSNTPTATAPEKSPSASPTSSRSVTHTVNGSHKFVIQGYSLAKGMGPGKHIASDDFIVGGYQWAVYFYPDGKNVEDNSTYVSIFIALASDGTDVRALFELTLVDQSGKGKHKVHSHFERSLESGPYTLKYRGSMWGYKRFLRRTTLENSDYLKDDCLQINCTVGVVVSSIERPHSQTISIPESNIGAHFGALLENLEGSDVTFNVDGEKFQAHSFHQALLHFIYTDSIAEDVVVSSSSSSSESFVGDNFMAKLLAAADKYGLERLRLMCESHLCKNLSVRSVAQVLSFAEEHHATELKAVCLRFAAKNLGAVMQSKGFEHLKENNPSLQSELLKILAQNCGDVCGNGSKSRSVWAQLSDGGDSNGRRVRQRT